MKNDTVSAGLDILYTEFDKKLWADDVSFFDGLFTYFKDKACDIHFALALLINTWGWRHRLQGRQYFLEQVEKQLKEEGKSVKEITGLLIGLE